MEAQQERERILCILHRRLDDLVTEYEIESRIYNQSVALAHSYKRERIKELQQAIATIEEVQ